MRVHIGVAVFISLMSFHLCGYAQTELILPLNPDFIPSAMNPASMAGNTTASASIAFRNQIQFRNARRIYEGNLFSWEVPVDAHASHLSYWGMNAFSSIETGIKRLKCNALYAYSTPLNASTHLRLGIQMGFDHRRYGNSYLFPDDIYGSPQNAAYTSKASLSVALGGEIIWKQWTAGIAIHQLGNQEEPIRSIISLHFNDVAHWDVSETQILATLAYYHIDNQDQIRLSTGMMWSQIGWRIAQTFGMQKSESTSTFGLNYQFKHLHFQYDIGWSYYNSALINSTGFRSEFGIIYLLSN